MAGFSKNMVNLITSPKGSALNYRSEPNTRSKILHTSQRGKSGGRTTGDFFKMTDGTWWRVLLNNRSQSIAYVRGDVTSFNKPSTNPKITEAQAQRLINNLVKSDIAIFDNLIFSGNLLKKLDAGGKNVGSYKKTYEGLLTRHTARQEKIKTSRLLRWKIGYKRGQDKGILMMKNWLLKSFPYLIRLSNINAMFSLLTSNRRVGAVPVIGYVVGAFVLGGLSVAVYFAFVKSYSESKKDLVETEKLKRALSTLSPQDAKEVRDNLEKQIDSAYKQGSAQGKFSGVLKIIKPLLIGGAGYWLVTKFLKSQKTSEA